MDVELRKIDRAQPAQNKPHVTMRRSVIFVTWFASSGAAVEISTDRMLANAAVTAPRLAIEDAIASFAKEQKLLTSVAENAASNQACRSIRLNPGKTNWLSGDV